MPTEPVTPDRIGGDVRRFITAHLDSVSALETLLLLHGEPDRGWTADEVAGALVTKPSAAEGFLRELRDHGLVSEHDGRFRYAPHRAVDALAETYATRRHTVIGLIFDRPDPAASALADAFRFRKGDD